MSLLFYDRNAGHGELYRTDGQGGISQLNSYDGWRRSWSHIVPTYATEMNQYHTALLFYDKNSGVAQFYNVDAQGHISQLSNNTYSTGWTHIIPGSFVAGSADTALLFYNSSSGLAQFYSTDGQGNIFQLSSNHYSAGWTHIIPGWFTIFRPGGAGESTMALLFYNSGSGLAQFYSTDGQGGITQLSNNTYSAGWTHIIPGSFVAGYSNTALLFYNSNSGLAQFYSTDGQGGINQLSSTTYSKDWTFIVPCHLGATYTDLLFYNRSSGLGQFYVPDGQGGINQLSSHTGWRTSWAEIVSVDLPHA